ncbi:hypothetical protein AAIA72_11350 [Hahella sp. SMD15-11]|uniref:Uncharacterized protein n=1 Tax=Thermohahella caldifontis TaxID=3142973 RepID=A0AB39UTH4_9GAMM
MKGIWSAAALWGMMVSPLMADPLCNHPDGWVVSMGWVYLKNAGVVGSAELDTAAVRAERLASEPLGGGRYRQVYHVTYPRPGKPPLELITLHVASDTECSETAITAWQVSATYRDEAAGDTTD